MKICQALIFFPSTTAPALLTVFLNRRAGVGAVRAIHAAVARQRAQHRLAVRAVVKPLAGIGGHGLAFGKAALGAGEGGLQGDGGHGVAFNKNNPQSTETPVPAAAARTPLQTALGKRALLGAGRTPRLVRTAQRAAKCACQQRTMPPALRQ